LPWEEISRNNGRTLTHPPQRNIKSKLDLARPNNKDSPSSKRQQELRAELGQIRTQQQSSKSSRGQVMDKVKRLDETLKSRIAEQKVARGKNPYKSVDEIDQQILRLQKSVDAGTMKIVDEKKALADISQLNRQKKSFAGFDQAQKGIDEVKAQIAELKKTMDDPASRALSDRYTEITTELDKIKAEQDEVYKNLNALRDERTAAHEDQQKKYTAVKEIKDKFYSSRRAAVEYEREARRIRDEKRRAENEAYHRGRRQEVAKEKLEEASAPAYQDEIRTTQALLYHFDPSSVAKPEAAGPGKFAAAATRKVEGQELKGTLVKSKKDNDEDFMAGTGGKKKKGGKRDNAAPAAAGKFQLDVGTIENLGRINVDPPMQQSDVPAVVEKLKEKLAYWKENQESKTKEVSRLYDPNSSRTQTLTHLPERRQGPSRDRPPRGRGRDHQRQRREEAGHQRRRAGRRSRQRHREGHHPGHRRRRIVVERHAQTSRRIRRSTTFCTEPS
jgi:uncharacterized coiled-coil DUF342 family protein